MSLPIFLCKIQVRAQKIFLGSLFFYVIMSFVSVFSPSIYVLIICRFLQGIGIAGIGAVVRAIAVDCFEGKNLIKAFTYVSTSWALGPIVGPFIGGYLQHFFNWQADFYFFGLYGLFIFIYAAFTLLETNLFLQPLHPTHVIRSIKDVILNPIFLLITVILALDYAVIIIFNMVGPFLVQVVLKYSAVNYGHIALFLGFGYFGGNFSNQWLIKYFSSIAIARTAMITAAFLSFLMIGLGCVIQLNLWVVVVPTFFILACLGFVFPNLTSEVFVFFPKNSGTASAIFGSLTAVGAFVVTSFATLLKTHSQMPMALTYAGLLLINLILFFWSRYFKTSNAAHQKENQ